MAGRKRFAAVMLASGLEYADGVDALSMDDRIVKLRRGAGSDRVLTFSLSRCSLVAFLISAHTHVFRLRVLEIPRCANTCIDMFMVRRQGGVRGKERYLRRLRMKMRPMDYIHSWTVNFEARLLFASIADKSMSAVLPVTM